MTYQGINVMYVMVLYFKIFQLSEVPVGDHHVIQVLIDEAQDLTPVMYRATGCLSTLVNDAFRNYAKAIDSMIIS